MTRRIPPDAFDYYLGLGPSRSYEVVADHYQVSKRAVSKRATKECWQERLARIEARAREESERKSVESLETMTERHLRSLKVIQAKALETLRGMSLSTAMEAVRALDLAIKQERTIRGQPGDRTAVSIEELIRHEYASWLVTGPEESNDAT